MYIGLHLPTKKGCCPTRRKGPDYIVRSSGQVVLAISTEHKKATKPLSSKLDNECGTIIRNHAPLNVKSWKQTPGSIGWGYSHYFWYIHFLFSINL